MMEARHEVALQRFLAGEMDAGELASFEADLREDAGLRRRLLRESALIMELRSLMAQPASAVPGGIRARRPLLVVSASVLASAAAILVLMWLLRAAPGPEHAAELARLTDVHEAVRVHRAGQAASPAPGEALRAGDRVAVPSGASATVVFGDGSTATVTDGEVTLTGPGEGLRLRLSRGTARCAIAAQTGGRRFAIATPHAIARVLGTRFDLGVDGLATRLAVSEGAVELATAFDPQGRVVVAGMSLMAGAEGWLPPPPGRSLPSEGLRFHLDRERAQRLLREGDDQVALSEPVVEEAGSAPGGGPAVPLAHPGRFLRIRAPGLPNTDEGVVGRRTVALRFRAQRLGEPSRQVLYKEGGASRGLTIYLEGDRIMVGGFNLPAQESGWSGTWLRGPAVTAGRWHHASLVLSAGPELREGGLTGYLDGKAFGTGSASQLWHHPNHVVVGNVSDFWRFDGGWTSASEHGFTGAVADIRIYARALPADQIRLLAEEDPPGEAPADPSAPRHLDHQGAQP